MQTIENWLPETYDILFINLDRETHQELARAGKIREKDEKIHMILTSENQENIQETFDLMPAVYLITPIRKRKSETLDTNNPKKSKRPAVVYHF